MAEHGDLHRVRIRLAAQDPQHPANDHQPQRMHDHDVDGG
jgi:hypothetical protein